MQFEWDPQKSDTNRKKHDVSFDEAAAVFGDPLAITIFDSRHSLAEQRFFILGESELGRLLIVSFTERRRSIRIFSARLANRRERREYES